jgi:hypothetical protein
MMKEVKLMPERSRFSLDIPQVVHGVQTDYKRLYYSNPDAALKVPITIMAGYGLLEVGTALAKNLSAAGKAGLLVPYNPTTFTGAENHPGRAYLVANSGTTDKFVYVTMDDSYKFNVGDDLIINDDTTAAENLGAITAIDRTSEPHRAKITATTAIGGTAFTTARKACVFVEAGTSGNNYSDCVGILEKSVDTGIGSNAKGAVATLILGNAVLYEGTLTNMDDAAKTDISASSFGQYLYMR